jgi:protein TonB
MLDRLLETGARERKSAWGGVASVVVHGAIIALAVYSTAEAGPRPRFVPDPPPIPIISPPQTEQTSTHRGGHTGGRVEGDPVIPRIPVPGTPVDVEAAVAPVITATGGDDSLLAEISGRGTGSEGMVGGVAGVTSEITLDVPVRVVTERTPAYPEMLRAAGIAGTVRLQFIVDTTGRAEPSSIRILDSSHDLFTRAVLAALRQSRFTAGEVGGRRVRTLVERSYRFDISGLR